VQNSKIFCFEKESFSFLLVLAAFKQQRAFLMKRTVPWENGQYCRERFHPDLGCSILHLALAW